MNRIGVVIHRYYENLTWLHNVKSNLDVYVYDRIGESPGMGLDPNYLPWSKKKDPNDNFGGLNVDLCKQNGLNLKITQIQDDPGFEPSTWLQHIINNYDSLNDYSLFIQGHPEVYCKNIIYYLNNPHLLMHMRWRRDPNGSYGHIASHAPYELSEDEIELEFMSDQSSHLISTQDYQWELYKHDFSSIPWLKFCKNMPGSFYDENQKWYPKPDWYFAAGSSHIIHKRIILENDLNYYRDAWNFVNTYRDPHGDLRPKWQQMNQGPNIMEGIYKFFYMSGK